MRLFCHSDGVTVPTDGMHSEIRKTARFSLIKCAAKYEKSRGKLQKVAKNFILGR